LGKKRTLKRGFFLISVIALYHRFSKKSPRFFTILLMVKSIKICRGRPLDVPLDGRFVLIWGIGGATPYERHYKMKKLPPRNSEGDIFREPH